MNIRKETIYIMESCGEEKVLRLGEHTTLVFHDGRQHSGEIIEIFEVGVTIKIDNIGRSFGFWEIQEIKQ